MTDFKDNVGFELIDLGASGSAFKCHACPRSRLMQPRSQRIHKASKSHTENLALWISQRTERQSNIARFIPVQEDGPPVDQWGNANEGDDGGDLEGDIRRAEQQSSEAHAILRQSILDNLWLVDCSQAFFEPDRLELDSEADSKEGGEVRTPEQIAEDLGETEDHEYQVEDDELNTEESEREESGDGNGWYPLQSKEASI